MAVLTRGVALAQVWLNGVEDSVANYPRLMSFVPQKDIVHGILTVRQNLYYAGQLRLPASTSKEARGSAPTAHLWWHLCTLSLDPPSGGRRTATPPRSRRRAPTHPVCAVLWDRPHRTDTAVANGTGCRGLGEPHVA